MQHESPAPGLVTALCRAWTVIRARHSDVPEVVLTIASGTAGGARKLGHFADCRWQRTTGEYLPELFISGEGLARGPRDVLGTLLHEAAHGIASTRGIKDTSRQGRFHNGRFRVLAEELGLGVARTGSTGWSATTVPDATAVRYRDTMALLGEAITVYRHAEHGSGRASSNNGVAAACGCGRRIRAAESVLAAGPITCGLCGGRFKGPSA
jgi:hypothetical protein